MEKRTVLIVEDEQSLLEVLSYNLELEGYQVLTASDGKEGLQCAQKKNPRPYFARPHAANNRWFANLQKPQK